MKLTILIPAFNERKEIATTLTRVARQRLDGLPFDEREILVVDDGSTDGTPDVVRKWLASEKA